MVPVRCAEQAGDCPWIWCVCGCPQLLAKRKTHQHREECSKYDISSFHDLIFSLSSFIVLAFSDFFLENSFSAFMVHVDFCRAPRKEPARRRSTKNAGVVSTR